MDEEPIVTTSTDHDPVPDKNEDIPVPTGPVNQQLLAASAVPDETPVDLARLRRFRGYDEAVQRLAAPEAVKNNLLDILRNPKGHSRDDVLKAILANYSGEAYGDEQWRKTDGGWTTPKVPTIYGQFRIDHPELAQLSLDTGFVTHLPEFTEMDALGADSLAVRDKMKERLGEEIVYRGMTLTDEELEDIKTHGIMSGFPDYVAKAERPKEELEANVLSTNVNELYERHFHHENPHSPLISVSAHSDIATAVGRHFGKHRRREGAKFYLFKLKVPKIDIVHYSEHGIRKPSKLQGSTARISVSLDGAASNYDFDEKVESYMFWKIDPSEILEITQPDIKESEWNGNKTLG